MFLLVDIRRTGLPAKAFGQALLDDHYVSVLSAEVFGPSGAGLERLSLTVGEQQLKEACRRLIECARHQARSAA